MQIIEMVNFTGPDESESSFYKENTEKSREHFMNHSIEMARLALKEEQEREDVIPILLENCQEQLDCLIQMKEEFILKGFAKTSMYFSLNTFPREVITV